MQPPEGAGLTCAGPKSRKTQSVVRERWKTEASQFKQKGENVDVNQEETWCFIRKLNGGMKKFRNILRGKG